MVIKEASAEEISNIANLHAISWQQNYDEVLAGTYLLSTVFRDRADLWTLRLTNARVEQLVLFAEIDGVFCGFICVYGGQHPQYGTIIDNLHVHADFKGLGMGKKLILAAATWADTYYKTQGVYLEVLACNLKAQGFYQSIGAQHIDGGYWNTPCGNSVEEYIYCWTSPRELIANIALSV